MQKAQEPWDEREFAGAMELAEGSKIFKRVPKAMAGAKAGERRQMAIGEAVVDERGEVEAAVGEQAVGRRETGVALDQLQLAVALVELELGIGQPPQANLAKQPQR